MRLVKTKTRRIKFWIHLFFAYFSRYKIRLAVVILTVLTIFYSSIKIWSNISKDNLLAIGYVGSYTLENIPAEALSLATDSLITFDPSGKPISSMASYWTVSDDGKTYLVFLKDNLVWHDDTKVEAKDISIAIDNVTITALNNKTIEFKLKNPISSFPSSLVKPVFKSKTFYGTGKFRISAIDSQKELVKRIRLTPKDKDLPRVDIKFYQTEDQLTNAIKIGEVKYASVANAQIFENWPNLRVSKTVDTSEVVTIFFNTQDQILSSQEMRQALTYALNRSGFDGTAASGPISQTSWAYNSSVKKYEYNTGKAKELLNKSQVKNPKIVLTSTLDLMNLANSIKKNWQDLGIEVEIKETQSIPKDFQALLATEKIPQDPDQYALWHSTQKATNLTKLTDVKIDKLLEDARTTQDENTRKDLYADFQKFLTEDSPAAFLYYPNKYQVTYKNIKPLVSKLFP